MAGIESDSLVNYLAEELKANAEALSRAWVELLAERLGTGVDRVLPYSEETVDHVPGVVRWLAEYIRLPTRQVKSEVRDRLRLFMQIRQEHGRSIEETLEEFEWLGGLIADFLTETIEAYPRDADPGEVSRVWSRIREALASMLTITVAMWRQEDSSRRSELSRRLEEFARMTLHELKTPLNAIQLWCSLLLEEYETLPDAQRRTYLEQIGHSVHRMDDLLEGIRSLAVAEGAQAEQRWMSLRTVVELIFSEMREAALEDGVELRVKEPLAGIEVDAVQVEIALMNLVSNSIKYCDPEKEERWIEVASTKDESAPDTWRITVADNGLGIPQRLQHKVFRRYFRAHPDVADGTGLGLAIAEQVVEQRQGTNGFESEEGAGTTFNIVIPAREHRSPGDSDVETGGVDEAHG